MTQPVLLADRIRTSIELGESHFREFKSAHEGPPHAKKPRPKKEVAKDVCRTLVGFANADGGTLLVGVEDDGEVTGFTYNQDDEQYLRECWRDGVHPRTPLSEVQVGKIVLDNGPILYFYVPKSVIFVHQTADGRCLQRRDLETVPITVEEVQYTRAERTSQEYDRQFVDAARVNDLNAAPLDVLANQISKGMSREKCLQHLGLADFADGTLRLRRAALLLFANDVARWHPRVQIRIFRVAGLALETGVDYNVVADEQVQGNIVEIIEVAWDTLRPHLVQTKFSENAKFESRVMYPELACREALINAIAHRDYSQEGRGIEIYIFNDRLEVRSPGALLSTLSVAGLKSLTGAHQSRNTFIARSLRELCFMREIGEGVRRIFELMKSNELEEPEFNTDLSTFSISLSNKTLYSPQHVLWLENFISFDLSREEKAIVVMGYDGKVLSANDIWNGLGIVDTDDFRKLVTNLSDKRILSNVITKAKASRIAGLSKINVRDVPRFKIAVPEAKSTINKPTPQLARSELASNYDDAARLFLGNLPHALTKEQLLTSLRDQGYKVDVVWPKRRRGAASSHAFLQFESVSDAERAMNALNGLDLVGHKLVARKAFPMKQKAAPSG